MGLRRTAIWPGLVIVLGLGLALVGGGCAYFNLFYNAQDAFDEGERLGEEIDVRDRPTNSQRTQYNRAIRKCQMLLDEYPDSGLVDDALFLTGKSYYRMREWSEAIRNFESLLVNFPASDFAEESTYLLSISYLSRGDEEQGLQWFARLREGYPDGVFAAEALYRLGDAWANAGRLVRAAESYEEFLETYPDRPEAARTRVALTRIKLEAGEPEEALAALDGFTTEKISSPRQRSELRYEAETLRVDALIKLERFEEALASVEVADAAAESDTDRRKVVLLRGRALLRAGRVEEGRKVLKDLVESESLQPEATTARRISIEYFSRHEGPGSEQLREEIESAENAGRMAGPDVSVVRNHVAQLKTYDRLLATYDSGDSTASAAAFALGEIVFTSYKRPGEAFTWYSIALALDPTGPLAARALYAMGWLKTERLDEPEAGEQWFAQLQECCPDSPQARARRGEEFVQAKPRTREELEMLAGLGPGVVGGGIGPVNLDDPRQLPWRSLRRGGPGALSSRESGL
jgi:tetratricopeptide (TPR) repeat protein